MNWDRRYTDKVYINSMRCYIRDNLNFYYGYSLTETNYSPHTKKPYVKNSPRDREIKRNLNLSKLNSLVDAIERVLPDKVRDYYNNYSYRDTVRLRVYK